jgi:hypothetical protein
MKDASVTDGLWVQITMIVSSENNVKLLTAVTPRIELKQPVVTITKATMNGIGKIQQQYFDNQFQSAVAKQGGLVPAGNYKIEFVCNSFGTTSSGAFPDGSASTSYQIRVTPMSPIQLVQVYNKETIKEQNPMFTWLPPFPLPAGTQLDYELILTELHPNQSAASAIMANQPLQKIRLGNKLAMHYSNAAPRYIKGDNYAWKVQAYDNQNHKISESETWQFKYDFETDTIVPDQYYVMERELKSSYVTIDSNLLGIKFVEDYKVLDSLSHIYLYDEEFTVIGDENSLSIAYHTGSNYTYVNFCPDVFPLANGIYVLEVALLNENTYYIRFNNISNANACY